MDFYVDVLDHMGKTPREFGAVHAHLESAIRGAYGGVVTLLFQAAFDPCPPPRLAIYSEGASRAPAAACGEFAGPELEDGVVVRARFPVRFSPAAEQAFVLFEAPLAKDADRIRPVWKLVDTLEMPKLSEMTPGNFDVNVRLNVGTSLLYTAALAATGRVGVSFTVGGPGPAGEPAAQVTVHKAKELPPGLSVAIVNGDAPKLAAPAFEVIWKPGMPLPDPVATPTWQRVAEPPPPRPSGAVRRCMQCLFEGDAAEYERARFCPSCDAIWN